MKYLDIKRLNLKTLGQPMKDSEEKVNIVPNAAFPFCVYNYKPEGINLTTYNETYCNQFQVKY